MHRSAPQTMRQSAQHQEIENLPAKRTGNPETDLADGGLVKAGIAAEKFIARGLPWWPATAATICSEVAKAGSLASRMARMPASPSNTAVACQ